MGFEFCRSCFRKRWNCWVRQLILLGMTLASLLATTYFGLWFVREMTGRVPSLESYSIQRWINLAIIIFTGFTLILSCLTYQTVFSQPKNISRYQKVTPLLVIATVVFSMFAIASFAIYYGVTATPEDFFSLLEKTRGTGKIHYKTDDGFEIPSWLNCIQKESKCCGVNGYEDFRKHGRLNFTHRTIRQRPLGVPMSCCNEANLNHPCEESIDSIFKHGCFNFLQDDIKKLQLIGVIGNVTLAVMSLLTFKAFLDFRKDAVEKLIADKNRGIEEKYNLSEGYFAHLEDIYMDAAGKSRSLPE